MASSSYAEVKKGTGVMAATYPFVLKANLGDECYTALVDLVDERREEMLPAVLDRFERRLTQECSNLRVEMNGLRTEMAHHHAELMKWALVAWVSQTAAVAAIVAVFQ
jgi:hypothetical protein